uniref:Uncharacterized protein n=1 Tax=Arundo donax TaxID=35708 RepID=A0A0A8Z5T6_ARUDO
MTAACSPARLGFLPPQQFLGTMNTPCRAPGLAQSAANAGSFRPSGSGSLKLQRPHSCDAGTETDNMRQRQQRQVAHICISHHSDISKSQYLSLASL